MLVDKGYLKSRYTYFFVIFFLWALVSSHAQTQPVAKFHFNNGSEYDEINNRKAKLLGVSHITDRFGNDNHAVYFSGNMSSYINLGSYKELKPTVGTISLWVNIEYKAWSGKGPLYNPIILTKYTRLDDFYEAYAIYYLLETNKLVAVSSQDSTKEVGLFYLKPFERNKWHHIVIAYNNENFWMYVDGRLEGKISKNFETKFLETDSVMLGTTANKKNMRFLIGMIDDVEFYDKVLTENEVNELYNAPNPNQSKIVLQRSMMILLIGGILFLVYLLIRYYIKVSLRKGRQRLELANLLLENELRINRALMNPHFIFNSLNTLHNYILMNNVDRASNYLIKFSKLIRKILDSNLSDAISLEMEIELIQRYMEIESLRFNEHLKYAIIVEPSIASSFITIPIMMVQPFIENAVWHGLKDKSGDKMVTVSFSLYEEKYLKCVIEDNGTGRKKRSLNNLEKKSLGTGFVQQRLNLLNRIHNLSASLTIVDKAGNSGTLVTLILPILNK